jgi:hypothetical protein
MMLIVIPLALFGDLRKAYHYFKKKVIAKNAVKVCYFSLHIVVLDLEVSLQDISWFEVGKVDSNGCYMS